MMAMTTKEFYQCEAFVVSVCRRATPAENVCLDIVSPFAHTYAHELINYTIHVKKG
jgi:hypothetical protein